MSKHKLVAVVLTTAVAIGEGAKARLVEPGTVVDVSPDLAKEIVAAGAGVLAASVPPAEPPPAPPPPPPPPPPGDDES